MNPLSFFFREISIKFSLILFFATVLIYIIMNHMKYIWFILLSPLAIKETLKNNHIDTEFNTTTYYINQINKITNSQYHIYNDTDTIFIPNLEINIPLYISPNMYIIYYGIILLYIIIPTMIAMVKFLFFPILKKKEKIFHIKKTIYLHLIFLLNWYFIHNLVIHLLLKITFDTYQEIDLFEFDIEFQILNYVNIYLKILYANLILVCVYIYILKKNFFYFFLISTCVNTLYALILPPFLEIYIFFKIEIVCIYILYTYYIFFQKKLLLKISKKI